MTVKFHSIEGFRNHTLFDWHMEEYNWPLYTPLYMTALQTSRQHFDEPRDLFGNVRVPDPGFLSQGNGTSQPSFDWHTVQEESAITYTSLLGVPIVDIPRAGRISFPLESSCWETRCSQFNSYNPHHENHSDISLSPGGESYRLQYYLPDGYNGTQPIDRDNSRLFLEYSTKTLIASKVWVAFKARCTVTLRLVESFVECEKAACRVQKMHYLDRDFAQLFRKADDENYDWFDYLMMLYNFMPGADQKGNARSSELVEMWMADPYSQLGGRDKYVNLSELPPGLFGRRLQTAMNTFWDSTMGSLYRMGNLTSEDLKEQNQTDPKWWTSTNATGERYLGEQYVCNTTFAALSIIISWLLFMAASISVLLRFITTAPDILGYVSTLARDDPYFATHVPSHLDGIEASRTLRGVRIVVGDVHKEADVGHIAFASMDIRPARVSKNRLYD